MQTVSLAYINIDSLCHSYYQNDIIINDVFIADFVHPECGNLV